MFGIRTRRRARWNGAGLGGRRSGDSDAEPQTRAYLLTEERSFCTLMVSTLLNGGKESGQCAFDQLSPRVDAFADGREVRHIHGWELPDGHWARALGLDRNWMLGTDDVLREEISPVSSIQPDRVRRSAGNGGRENTAPQ